MGYQNFNECWCANEGEKFDRNGQLSDSACGMDKTGGPNSMAVFDIESRGKISAKNSSEQKFIF